MQRESPSEFVQLCVIPMSDDSGQKIWCFEGLQCGEFPLEVPLSQQKLLTLLYHRELKWIFGQQIESPKSNNTPLHELLLPQGLSCVYTFYICIVYVYLVTKSPIFQFSPNSSAEFVWKAEIKKINCADLLWSVGILYIGCCYSLSSALREKIIVLKNLGRRSLRM